MVEAVELQTGPQVFSETVLLARIGVEERVREELGDVVELARSIEAVGLIHAIVVDEEYRLICGGRRLAALKQSGAKMVDVRRFLGLDEKQKRLMELEENRRRKDLTPYEWAKTITEKAEIVREIAQQADLSDTRSISPAHRPVDPTSAEQVGRAIGLSRPTMRRAEEHVKAAEQYPFMQDKEWSQSAVLKAKQLVDSLGNGAKEAVVALITEAKKPELSVQIAAKVAEAPPAEREEFVRLSQSKDQRERDRAATWAADREPEPDPRLAIYRQCVRELKQSVRRFPNDPEVPEVNRCIGILESVVVRIAEKGKEAKDGAVDA